jgi:undecaprenyldiphospho-muramoylpentapeptide beta-N-acetylglucosaminyltransferase
MSSSIVISAGGTGGGVYPAVAVAEALRHVVPAAQLHYVGSAGGMEHNLVPRELFASYNEVQSGPLNGVSPGPFVVSLVKLAIGTVQAWRLTGRTGAKVLFLTGGWATFPAALAAWLRRIPIAIFVPDIEPALAIKVMSRFARMIMATTGESVDYFPKGVTVVETGYPLRTAIIGATRSDAIALFSLDPACKTLLVFGGSRGARSINTALSAILPDLLADGLQVIHISGELDWPTVQARRESLSAEDQQRYHACAYLHSADMGLALAAADLAVSRAGASTLGEFPQLGLPSILAPYPFAWRYQKTNADWLATRGAAVRINDEMLSTELLPAIRAILGNPARLKAMRRASAALARPDASAVIARKIVEIGGDLA